MTASSMFRSTRIGAHDSKWADYLMRLNLAQPAHCSACRKGGSVWVSVLD
jgi:hypothetical protein